MGSLINPKESKEFEMYRGKERCLQLSRRSKNDVNNIANDENVILPKTQKS